MSLKILVPLHPGYIRVALRLYFIVVLLFIALVGDVCCHLATKLRLLRGQNVTLPGMTGWVRGFKSFGIFARLRRLPGGWLGGLMMLTAVIAIAADIAVSASVNLAPFHSQCTFRKGLVVQKTDISWYPSYSSAAYQWANNAQDISAYNGGKWGIFKKADNSTNFAATEEDLLGKWVCAATVQPIPFDNMRDVDILSTLASNNLLYNDAMYTNVSNQYANGALGSNSSQLIIMSTNASSASNLTGSIWNVKFALDIKDGKDLSNDKLVQAYTCNIVKISDPEGLIDATMGLIQTKVLLTNWLRIFQGQLWEDLNSALTVENVQIALQEILNSIVMIAGAGNSISRTTDDLQGCIIDSASVPTPLIGLGVFVALLALWMVCYCITLWITIRSARREYDRSNDGSKVTSKEILDSVPNGLLDWMSHAAHESNSVQKRPKHHHLGKWLLSTRHHGGRRMGVVQQHHSEASVPLATPPTPFSDFSSPGFHGSPHMTTSYMGHSHMGQKTDYVSVNTSEFR